MRYMHLFIAIASSCLLSACITDKTAWEYYDECAVIHSDFVEIARCGKESRTAGCVKNNSCSARGNALVQYADSLVASVKSKELSQAEAMRKWLEYRRDEENSYNANLNAILTRQAITAPVHTNCTNTGTYTHCSSY